jgi:HEAT repeat protein
MKLAILLLITLLLPAVETPAARAREVLSKGAADQEADTRREVAIALSLISSRDPAASLLGPLVRDKDYAVRETTILSIGELNDAKLAATVKPALGDDVPEVAFAAARTLAKLKQPEGKRALLSIVGKETKGESGFLREKMRDVSRRMRTPKSALLFAVQQGVSFVPVPGIGQGYSAMNSMLADADFSARATALLVLATDRSPEVRALINESFADDDWSVRAAAVQASALRSERTWQSRLEALFNDSNKKVRFRAAAVYLRLNQVRSRP